MPATITVCRNGTQVDCRPIRWTATGHIQIERRRVIGSTFPALLAVVESVPAMALSHSEGRAELAQVLARLPKADT